MARDEPESSPYTGGIPSIKLASSNRIDMLFGVNGRAASSAPTVSNHMLNSSIIPSASAPHMSNRRGPRLNKHIPVQAAGTSRATADLESSACISEATLRVGGLHGQAQAQHRYPDAAGCQELIPAGDTNAYGFHLRKVAILKEYQMGSANAAETGWLVHVQYDTRCSSDHEVNHRTTQLNSKLSQKLSFT
ncbi:hypothetical protein CIB48_g4551 [Xylaria polymorpha]|nr:hypothetical protein CIB48_g4551 [Xylaria polymorpha]